MATFTVTNLNDSGAGSLRAALLSADGQSGTASTIVFNVSGTVTLASDLPPITQNVTIDATQAPGATTGGAPVVGIDFNNHGGLTFASGSDGSSLLGVAVGGASGNGITIASSNVTIAGDYVGLTTAGTALGNGAAGIYMTSTSSDNTIGSNPTADSGVVSNVISGNAGNGIVIDGSSDNTLVDNYVGTNPTGTTAMANGANGILITGGATNNLIGGTAYTDSTTGAENNPTGTEGTIVPAVIVTPPLGNLVSGNTGDGILINNGSSNNVLSGNFVGTTASGDSALGNGGDGVAIVGADNNSLIGCTALDNPFVYYNVVSGNGGNGLHITDSNDTTVQANFFGIGADNATVVGNAADGILVDGSSSNTQVGGVIPLGNVAAGNGTNGIEVAGTASHFISFNTFGGLFAFGGAAPNGNDGILITSTGGHNTLQTNVLSGNVNDGIEIGGNASGVTVDPNISGLATDGTSALTGTSNGYGNGNDGLEIDGTAHNNIIGGDQQSVIPENTFSGNTNYGVEITGSAYGNQVFSSNIGVDVVGNQAFANGAGGVLVSGSAHDNTIGGTVAAGVRAADVISGNDGNGVTLTAGTSNTTGYGAQGVVPIPNNGVAIDPGLSTGNTIADNQVFACFALGTRIATPQGEVAVEDLDEGDLVLTLDGAAQPITWIGSRHVNCRRHNRPEAIRPVRIRAHAFGPNQPSRDLRVSPDHAIFAEGVFIPVKYLINGSSIAQLKVAEVTYFHVELPAHAAIYAEGLPTESYLDTGDRASFANAEGAIALHPAFGQARTDVSLIWEALAYAPLRVTGAEIAAVRVQVAAAAPMQARLG
jgi:parallel beta-helix repeat protein